MRVYSALEPGYHLENLKLKELLDEYPFVDLCNVTRVLEGRHITQPLHPATWRFLTLMDPTVDRMISRESDSIIFARQVDAVRQWITESNATFHIMRDNWAHCLIILVGINLYLQAYNMLSHRKMGILYYFSYCKCWYRNVGC